MTDDELREFLKALAAKHLGLETDAHHALHRAERLRYDLEQLLRTARLLRALEDRQQDEHLRALFREEIIRHSPIERTRSSLEDSGLLDALEDAGAVVFAELRRSVIPNEDIKFLRQGGFTDDEIEVLLAAAI